jgi:hypothetical protein
MGDEATVPGLTSSANSGPADPTLAAQIQAEGTQATSTADANDPEDPGVGGINARTGLAKLKHAQAVTAAAVGSGFQFTPEQIETQLKHCAEQIRDLNDDLRTAQAAVIAVHSPAPDSASVAQADAVKQMMENAVTVIRADITYLTDWQSKLVAAKNDYLTNEHLTEQHWQGLARGSQA